MKLWANVYRSLNGAVGSVHETRALADQMAASGRLACVEFEFPGTLEAGFRAYILAGGRITFLDGATK